MVDSMPLNVAMQRTMRLVLLRMENNLLNELTTWDRNLMNTDHKAAVVPRTYQAMRVKKERKHNHQVVEPFKVDLGSSLAKVK